MKQLSIGLLVCSLLYALSSSLLFAQEKENSEFKMAVGLYNDGMYDLAVEQLKNYIDAYPSTSQSVEARFFLGLTQLKLKRYDEARLTFQNFALTYADHPKAPEAWTRVGDAFAALGEVREAASAYERVKVFHPKSPLVPESLLKAGRLYRQIGDRETAKKDFRSIIQDYPSSTSVLEARLALGELYAEDGQLDLAEQEIRRVTESNAPTDVKANALLSLGKLQASMALFRDAETTLASVTTVHKGTPAAIGAAFELGRLAMSAHDYPNAIDNFKAVSASQSADDSLKAECLFNIGTAHERDRAYGDALKSFETLLDKFPASRFAAQATLEAGRSALATGDANKAIRRARDLLNAPSPELKPRAYILAAEAATALSSFNDAAQYYSSFVDAYPDNPHTPEVLIRLAHLYQEQVHDYRKAMAVYDRLTQKYPRSNLVVDAMMGTAWCQEKLDDYPGALKTYSDIQLLYPSNDQFDTIAHRITFLTNHRLVNHDEGLEKLAQLVGDVLTEPSKATVAYHLGEIYFNDLKRYREASEQFDRAITNGLEGTDLVEATFLRARADDIQSEIDSTAIQPAIASYQSFLTQFPTSLRSDDAAYFLYRLKSKETSDAGSIQLAKDFLVQYPTSKHRDQLLFDLGVAAAAANDSTDALSSFETLSREIPQSPYTSRALVEQGDVYIKLNCTDSAVTCWKQAAGQPTTSSATIAALWKLAEFQWNVNNPPGAIELWKRIANEFFYSSLAEKASAQLPTAYVANGEFDEALASYKMAKEQQRSSPFREENGTSLLFNLGHTYEKKGDRQDAVRYYIQYLQQDRHGPYASKALYALGGLARSQGNKDLAAAYFTQAAALGGTSETSSEIANLLFQSEQYADAAQQYTHLAQMTDTIASKQLYQSRAIVATLRMDQLAEAQRLIGEFEKAFGTNDTYTAEFEYEKGMHFYRVQDYVSARKAFEKVADDYESTRFGPWAQFYLGKISEVSNKPEEAAKKYDYVLSKFPTSDVIPRALLSLGNMHFNAERYEQAIKYYQQIVNSPETAGDVLPYAMNNLIEAYESMKVYDAALKLTRDYIQRYPNDESIIDKKIKVGTLYTNLGYYDQAVSYLQNLIGEAGSTLEAEIRYDIGEAYYNKGDYQQAVIEFLKVPYLVTKQGKVNWTATALYMAGQSYEKLSKFDEAISMYQQIVERTGIDATFKAAARKEIDRVKMVIKQNGK